MIDEGNTFGQIVIEKSRTMLESVKEWLSLLAPVGFAALIIYNIRGIMQAFRGSDNKWSVSEISKAVIIGVLIYMINKDGNREHEWRYFSDSVYFIFIAGLFAMAELKEIVRLVTMIINKHKGQDNEQTDSI